ncbi:P-loop containing nucleoside triphosphate hydrolase protein [Xylogone sp. PMI_703]|nr:P-loop containing nucleoside triphosphate hydrolase protein [Xylogone sp. PMI_703]
MSGRLLSARLTPLAQRVSIQPARRIHLPVNAGASGLLRTDAAVRTARRRIWPTGYTPFSNAVAVRNASFVRILPKLFIKLARVPALFAGATVSGVVYLQYQATQAGNYVVDIFNTATGKASAFAGDLFSGAADIADQTRRGWESTKEKVELPDWIQRVLRIHEEIGQGSGENGGEGPGGEPPKQSRLGAAAVASGSAAAYGYDQADQDPRSDEEAARDDQMMVLTKKMIEIRTILQTVGQSNALTLPSIVVIGSQSSGKSSVLEAIVGHEFLPKGSNMVTRRPIELTLVNTPDSQAEYGEFPALGLGKITDFSHIQRTLTELNLAVSDEECVSDDPIQLTISSPHVPDLSLIDLPGYIQVVGENQPLELKQKISELCDKYIQPPNVILAISAADVDLANSAALRASRRVDPRGERTIGVVTKMDLVDPVRGASILRDRNYPLRLGYVGVISRVPPQSTSLFKKGSVQISSAITKNENAYFSAHPVEFGPEAGLNVGTTTLRKKLMQVLEQTMAASLQTTGDAIQQELEEATYEFKVQYNDRPLSAETYLAESLDAFKHSFKEFAGSFGRPQVRELLKEQLDQRVLDILAARYWNKPISDLSPDHSEQNSLAELPTADPDSLYWHRKLDASTSALTKLGIGRLATTVIANAIQSNIDRLISQSTFVTHPFARQVISEAAAGILNERFYSTSDQVENCIKPFKFEIDVEDGEWTRGRENVASVLKEELKACEDASKRVEEQVGRRKLRDVIAFVDRARNGDVNIEGDGSTGAGGFSSALLAKGREAVFLRDRASLIKMRLMAVKSKQCNSLKNKYYCPEIFLDVVATKLTQTAVLFLNIELLSEFYYNFPRELDMRLGKGLTPDEIERFAKEDPKIKAHLEVIRRKELLELALEKMNGLKSLEMQGKGRRAAADTRKKDKGGWSLF